MTEEEIRLLHDHFTKLAELAKEHRLTDSHSVEEAMGRHKQKAKG
jgi:hypothetical protein